MNTEIKYNGYSANPSDYECPDGELATAVGVIKKDGEIHNICKPIVEADFEDIYPFEPVDIATIHKPDGHNNIIFTKMNTDKVLAVYYWFDKDESPQSAKRIYTVPKDETLYSVETIGNTIAINTSNGIRYALYSEEDVTLLGSIPDTFSLSFGLNIRRTISKEFTYVWYYGTGATSEEQANIDNKRESEFEVFMGEINRALADNMSKRFCFPFYLRYAYRLYDGSLVKHSAPVLMIPSTINPIARVNDAKGDGGKKTITYKLQILCAFSEICVLRNEDSWTELSNWKDVIKGIEIFVSAPIYTFDMAARSRDFKPKEVPSNEVVGELFGCDVETDPQNFTVLRFNDFWAKDTIALAKKIILPPLKYNYKELIGECNSFYRYAQIPIDSLGSITTIFPSYILKPIFRDLSSLTSQEQMTDDFSSHNEISGSASFVYNKRLNIGNVSKFVYKGFDIVSSLTYLKRDKELRNVKILVNKNGKKYIVGRKGVKDIYFDLYNNPLFFFYPDPDATLLQITTTDNVLLHEFELRPHPFLHGAYCYSFKSTEGTILGDYSTNTRYGTSNELYLSDVNNPFSFKAKYVVSVGDGNIIGLSSATQAISEGQFGQHPLYAFTTEGVWALSVSSDGSYSAVQAITRDVCVNKDSITQIDDAVLFATKNGVMMLSGSNTTDITDTLEGNPSDVIYFPKLPELARMAGYNIEDSIDMVSFDIYKDNLRILYDYVHQRIILYNPNTDYKYAYVFSLKDKTFGLIESNLKSNPKTYPYSLAMTHDNKLLNFSKDGDVLKGLILTRPLKLDNPDTLKTITSIIQRGDFRKGSINTTLYGSRDLKHWNIVSSSVDHILRGFSGTPYKYFRIAVVSTMKKDESLYGASIEWKPKETNKMR